MPYLSIDHISYLPSDAKLAAKAAEKVGWKRTPCPEGQAVSFGSEENLFQIWDRSPSNPRSGGIEYGIRVDQVTEILAKLSANGVSWIRDQWKRSDGSVMADVAFLDTLQSGGVALRFIEWKRSDSDRFAEVASAISSQAGVVGKRLDHFAVITHDLDVKASFWEKILGIPRFGVVTTATLLIYQYKIGDAIIELLGPADANSPLWQRDPCPAPMVSIEVADLDAAVSFANHAGFTAPAAAVGALPGTKTSTIPLAETGGLNWQLLQYV